LLGRATWEFHNQLACHAMPCQPASQSASQPASQPDSMQQAPFSITFEKVRKKKDGRKIKKGFHLVGHLNPCCAVFLTRTCLLLSGCSLSGRHPPPTPLPTRSSPADRFVLACRSRTERGELREFASRPSRNLNAESVKQHHTVREKKKIDSNKYRNWQSACGLPL